MAPPPDKRRGQEVLGRNLRAARERMDMSQEQVAAAMCDAGWTQWVQTTVGKAETAQRDVTALELAVLAPILGTTMERLMWPQGEDSAVAAVDMAIAGITRAWRDASDAALRLDAALAAGGHRLAEARASKYRRARDAARHLGDVIAERTVQSAFEDGLRRHDEGTG